MADLSQLYLPLGSSSPRNNQSFHLGLRSFCIPDYCDGYELLSTLALNYPQIPFNTCEKQLETWIGPVH